MMLAERIERVAGKRKTGKRDKSGRLLREKSRKGRERNIPGNDVVQVRCDRFAVFGTVGRPLKPEQHSDAPGQAHVAGLFNDLPADPVSLRDMAREYSDLYWSYYSQLSAKTANLGGSPAGRGGDRAQAWERRFQRLDEALGGMSSPSRQAVHIFCVNTWALSETPAFVERLINEQLLRRKRPVAGMLPTERDKDLWVMVCTGLLMLVSGTSEIQKRSAA